MGKNRYKREIKPKKVLGQHFLIDERIAFDIVAAIEDTDLPILEIGAGTGSLTQHLIDRFGNQVSVCEIDDRSIKILRKKYNTLAIYDESFLTISLSKHFPQGVVIVGNFPYNISSQIVFKILEQEDIVHSCYGMFQKEVAERICAQPGNKQYGQLTVLRSISYAANYLFTVQREAFDPPPKVLSGVIEMTRNKEKHIFEDTKAFKKFVKTSFLQRRKKLRNSLRVYFKDEELSNEIFDLRPEQLSLEQFIHLFHQRKA